MRFEGGFEWVKWKRNSKNGVLFVLCLLSIGIQLANQWDYNRKKEEKDYTELKALADEIQVPQE